MELTTHSNICVTHMTGSCSPFSSTNSLTAVCDGCQKTSHGKFKATRCAFVRRPAAGRGYTTYHREAVIRQFARQSSSRSHTCAGDDLAWPPVAARKKKNPEGQYMFVWREDGWRRLGRSCYQEPSDKSGVRKQQSNINTTP